MLAKHGEFFPFGASMTADGEVAHVGAYTGNEQPPSQEIIELLRASFSDQAKAGKIRAAAVCLDVRTVPPGQSQKTDAICVSLEHARGDAVDVYLPYTKGWFGKYYYGTLFAARRNSNIFSSPEGAA
jgi:hypothetical protein